MLFSTFPYTIPDDFRSKKTFRTFRINLSVQFVSRYSHPEINPRCTQREAYPHVRPFHPWWQRFPGIRTSWLKVGQEWRWIGWIIGWTRDRKIFARDRRAHLSGRTLGTQLQHRKHNQQLSRRNQPRLSSEPGASQACNNELVKLKGIQIFFLWKEILVYIYIYIIRKCNCNYSSMLKWCLENK